MQHAWPVFKFVFTSSFANQSSYWSEIFHTLLFYTDRFLFLKLRSQSPWERSNTFSSPTAFLIVFLLRFFRVSITFRNFSLSVSNREIWWKLENCRLRMWYKGKCHRQMSLTLERIETFACTCTFISAYHVNTLSEQRLLLCIWNHYKYFFWHLLTTEHWENQMWFFSASSCVSWLNYVFCEIFLIA